MTYCPHTKTRVLDSRRLKGVRHPIRRRLCLACGFEYKTTEHVLVVPEKRLASDSKVFGEAIIVAKPQIIDKKWNNLGASYE